MPLNTSIRWALIAYIVFLGIWLLASIPDWFFGGGFHQLKGMSTLFGFAGYTLFSFTLLLSSRWPKMETLFGGLDQIYRLHHQLGLWTFSILLIHPFIFALKWIPSDWSRFFLFIFPVHARISIDFGSIAFWLMLFLIAITLSKVFPYDKWKLTHQFMSLVFIVASLHVLLSERQFETSNFARGLLFIPMGIGFFGIFYKQVYLTFFKKFPEYEVIQTQPVNDNVMEVTLDLKDKPLNYIPGQYFFFRFKGEHLSRESHPFTLSSSPSHDKTSILVKSRGDFTRSLFRHIAPGYRVQMEGPYGRFDFSQGSQSQIWIAGGVGIVPFLAWIRTIMESDERERHIDMYYCAHRKEDLIFVEDFQKAASSLPSFRYFIFCSEEGNRICGESIASKSGDLQEKDIFMCGPRRLTNDLLKQLRILGIDRSRIHFEDFEFF